MALWWPGLGIRESCRISVHNPDLIYHQEAPIDLANRSESPSRVVWKLVVPDFGYFASEKSCGGVSVEENRQIRLRVPSNNGVLL